LNQALSPKHPELLGETGLLNARELLELTHGALALCQLTEQDQPILVGHGFEECSREPGGLPNRLDIEGLRGH
jgi:hypothetical protein